MEKRGVFIAFEGIDGSGKTTQIKKFVHYLFEKNKYNHIVFTRNPYKDANIRSILREGDDPLTQADMLATLFIEDRKKHAEEVILPALAKGHYVVSDRYKMSTLAYQSAQGLSMQELIARHAGLPVPDVTFIINTPIEVAHARMQQESHRNEHKFEKNLAFLENVRTNHLVAKELLKDEKIFVINGLNGPGEIFSEIQAHFEKEFG